MDFLNGLTEHTTCALRWYDAGGTLVADGQPVYTFVQAFIIAIYQVREFPELHYVIDCLGTVAV